jgi:hypothetical protein
VKARAYNNQEGGAAALFHFPWSKKKPAYAGFFFRAQAQAKRKPAFAGFLLMQILLAMSVIVCND